MVLRLKPMGKLATSREKKKKNEVLDRTKVLNGPQTQTYRETSYFQEKTKCWTELRSCIVLELKPMEKLATSIKRKLSTRQNQGLAWSLDSNLWGN